MFAAARSRGLWLSMAVALVAAMGLIVGACGPAVTQGSLLSDSVEDAERASYRVVVFCDNEEAGLHILEMLRSVGYTHSGNYVHPSPNTDYNIKWGGASPEVVDELVALVEREVRQPLGRLQVFGPDDRDVFINLPLGSAGLPGGKGQPATGGGKRIDN